jgi:hypothetical protein
VFSMYRAKQWTFKYNHGYGTVTPVCWSGRKGVTMFPIRHSNKKH